MHWAVTVPVADPPLDPLIATSPSSYAALFVVRKLGDGAEALERVARLEDFVIVPEGHLAYLEAKGPYGGELYRNAAAGDTLVFPDTAASLSYWLEDSVPYSSNSYEVLRVTNRTQGTGPALYLDSKLILPGYTFTSSDVNRWVLLSGFLTSSYNGYAQILSYDGDVATINKATPVNESGTTWALPVVEINPDAGSGLEPKYFPTRAKNLNWQLWRSGVVVASDNGGETLRTDESALVRTIRYTHVSPTQAGATALIKSVQAAAASLQRNALLNDTDITALITSTYQ